MNRRTAKRDQAITEMVARSMVEKPKADLKKTVEAMMDVYDNVPTIMKEIKDGRAKAKDDEKKKEEKAAAAKVDAKKLQDAQALVDAAKKKNPVA